MVAQSSEPGARVYTLDVLIELEFTSVGFCGGRKTGEPGEKPSEQGENQQQTQPTLDSEYGNRTQVTEAGGEPLSTTPTVLPRNTSIIRSEGPCFHVIVIGIRENNVFVLPYIWLPGCWCVKSVQTTSN